MTISSEFLAVDPGYVCGIIQDGVGYRKGEPAIRLHFEAYLGAPETYDAVEIEGSPRLSMKIRRRHSRRHRHGVDRRQFDSQGARRRARASHHARPRAAVVLSRQVVFAPCRFWRSARSAEPVCRFARPSADAVIACGSCGREIPLDFQKRSARTARSIAAPSAAGATSTCARTSIRRLGVAAVVTARSISAVFYWFKRDSIAYGVLAAAALLDFVVYRFLKLVTVCYRCHAEFRGEYPRTAAGFDLHTADVLEQEYERRIGRR